MNKDTIKPGDRVYIWAFGYGVPMYLVGKRGTVAKANRTTVRVDIDPRDQRGGEPTAINVRPAQLRHSGTVA